MLCTLVAVTLAVSAVASTNVTLRPWKAAGPGDSRGPCPMMNTLANHGYLPHHGRNLTEKQFGDAVVEALNAVAEYGTKPANVFIKGWGKDTFDLEDLNTPGILQHISSLTRDDMTRTNPNIAVNAARVSALLKDSPTSYVNAASIAKSRLRVEELSKPDRLSNREALISYLEAGLLLIMMKDGDVPPAISLPDAKTWTAQKERVQVWLTEERLPVELGWKRSERQLSLLDLVPAIKAIFDEKRAQSGQGPLWQALLSWLRGTRDEL